MPDASGNRYQFRFPVRGRVRASTLLVATEATVWPEGVVYPWPVLDAAGEAGLAVEVLSDSIQDAVGGTGASVVQFLGIANGFTPSFANVTLQGTTPVLLGNIRRVNALAVVTAAGDAGTNAGTIILRDVASQTTLAIIDPGETSAHMAVFTVPDTSLVAEIMYWSGQVSVNGPGLDVEGAEFVLRVRLANRSGEGVWFRHLRELAHSGNHATDDKVGFEAIVRPGTDLEIRVTATAAGVVALGTINLGWRQAHSFGNELPVSAALIGIFTNDISP